MKYSGLDGVGARTHRLVVRNGTRMKTKPISITTTDISRTPSAAATVGFIRYATGAGSLMIAQKQPSCFTESMNCWKSTGFTT